MNGVGMDECDLEAEKPAAGRLVHELGTGGQELAKRLCNVARLERDVMHAGPALGEEAPDRRVPARGREQLDPALADMQRCGFDSLLGEEVAELEASAEQPLVGSDRLVEIAHRDAE